MYNFNTTITNEGAALLARIIANQENAAFKEARLSETNYVGQEVTLTAGTFGGVKYTDPTIAASVIDSTTIKVAFDCRGSSLIGAYNLYSIGIIIDDNGTDVLVAVCTSSDPLPIGEEFNDRYAFNVNLAVSSTSNITVTGTTAAVIYDIDVIDNLASPATNKPLSANQGRLIADNLAADENVYGAKNLLDINNLGSMSACKCHVANNGFVNDETDTLNYFRLRLVAYDSNGQIIQVGGNNYVFSENVTTTGQKEITGFALPAGTANVLLTHTGTNINIYVNPTVNLDIIEIPLTLSFNANGINPSYIGGLDIRDIMLCDARVIDPTFAPFAETNFQLTRKTSGLSNENLLDNPFFTVNQRGFSSAIFQTGNVYTVDRWLIIGSTIGGSVSLSSSGMKLSRTGESAPGYLTQFLEDLTLGKPYTLSVLFSDGTIESKTGIINSTADSISFSFTSGLGSTRVYYFSGGSKWTVDVIVFTGSEFTIRAVKLEVGTVSTLANDVEPNQATELLKCQRYFYRLKALSSFAFFSSGIMGDATTYWGIINLPVPMRATPQVTSAGSVYIRQATNVLVSSITCALRFQNILSIFAVTATSLTAGAAALLALDSTSSYIDFSADL